MRDFSFIAQVVEVSKSVRSINPAESAVDIALGCSTSEGFKICVRVLAADVGHLLAGVGIPCCNVMSPVQPSSDLCIVTYRAADLSGEGFFMLVGLNVRASAYIPAGLGLEFRRMLQNPVEA